jgi:hypothetical protein
VRQRAFARVESVDPMSDSTERDVVEKSTVAARQGVTGHNVRYVLTISTASIIVLFAVLWLLLVR